MTADFSSYLDVPVEDIKQPTPPPEGHYIARVKSHKAREVTYNADEGPTPVYTIYFEGLTPLDDVDETLIPEGLANKMVSWDSGSLRDGTGQAQLRKIGEEAMELPVKGLTLTDLLAQFTGQEVKVFVANRMGKGKNEGVVFASVSRVFSPHA